MKFGFEIDFKNDVIHHGVTAILLSALLYTRVADPDLPVLGYRSSRILIFFSSRRFRIFVLHIIV